MKQYYKTIVKTVAISFAILFFNLNLNAQLSFNQSITNNISGNFLGIGNSSPSVPLHISQNGSAWIFLQNQSSNYPSTTKFGTVSSNNRKEFQLQYEKNLGFYDFAAYKWRFAINEVGNVGIGTHLPDAKLHVYNNAESFIFLENDHVTYPSTVKLGAVNQNNKKECQLQYEDNFGLYDHLNNKWRMNITANGRVGFGTITPQANVHIKDAGNSWLYLENNSANYPNLVKIGAVSSNNRKEFQIQYEDYFSLYDANDNKWRLRVDENGRVIIGDKTITGGPNNFVADVKLTVDGHAIFKKVIVTQSYWADFVFDKKYDLKPLNEVEEFIAKNKHLPDVPSESEVIKNGISLGDMDAILLQKIEELTLYLIQLEKQNQELSIEISKLKKSK